MIFCFSYVGFSILCNVIGLFPELSINILKICIPFPLSYSLRAFKQRENVLTCLGKYLNQIDTRRYSDYTITERVFL